MKTPEEIKKGLEYCMAGSPIVCNNCPYEGQFCEDDELLADALAYICQLEVAQPKWISVKKCLPEEGLMVLVLDKFGHINDRALRTFRDGTRLFRPDGLKPGTDVTHWMPLPKPLKEE